MCPAFSSVPSQNKLPQAVRREEKLLCRSIPREEELLGKMPDEPTIPGELFRLHDIVGQAEEAVARVLRH